MKRFIGAWRLVILEEVRPDGEVVYPYGKDAKGLLIYDPSGRVSVQIMRRDRTPLSASDWQDAPAEEIKAAVEGFTAFFGSYEIDDASRVVIHHVEGHLFPASAGKALRREFEFSGNRLILRPAPNRRVVWERVVTGNDPEKNGV